VPPVRKGESVCSVFVPVFAFPVSEEHAAGGFDSLTVYPEIVVRQQRSDRSADIVGQADAPKGNLRSDEFAMRSAMVFALCKS
jgi:hypothetical protein